MGKTAAGAVWLDAERLPAYEYYQFWINVEDADVVRFLRIYTFLPLDEIAELDKLKGAEIRRAKGLLAFEATRLTHGEEAAEAAREASRSLFGGSGTGDAVPCTELTRDELGQGIPAAELFVRAGLARSRSEARRLIAQGGAYINERQVAPVEQVVTLDDLRGDGLLLRAGKKRYHRVSIVGD